MNLNLRRRTDSLRSIAQRMRDFFVRTVRRQTQFSVASAALAAVLAITMLVDIVVGHAHLQRTVVAGWLSSYLVLVLLPLIFGRRYPRWAGLVFIAYLTFWSAYSLMNAAHAHAILNTLLEAPMIGLYLGWFYRSATARVVLTGYLAVLSAALLLENNQLSYEFSPILVLAYTLLISFFCLETGSHLYRTSRYQALRDPLTGALNRRGLNVYASRVLAGAERTGQSVSLFAVDFDNFKAINDERGHAAGDEALCRFGSAFTHSLKRGDLVARTGGDEFAILVHGGPDEAHVMVEEIRERSPYEWSWGQAEHRPGDSLDDLLRRADQELYRHKRANRLESER